LVLANVALISAADEVLSDVFPGDGVMSKAMRRHDWAATPLGPPHAWPEGLKVPLRMMLTSRFEMWLGWGPDLAFFYNDAYLPTLGVKHPDALGLPVRDVWAEVFAAVEDRVDSVMRDGIATWDKALLLLLERNGYPEETYHTFSYSPLMGEAGAIDGLMCVVTEETERVLSERQLDTLGTLAASMLSAHTRSDVLLAVQQTLRTNRHDFPFGFMSLFDGAEASVSTTAADAAIENAAWPFADITTGETSLRLPLAGLIADPPTGAWDRPPTEALMVPIVKAGHGTPSGALVLAVNPYRPNDPRILDFAQILAGQIAGVLATVDAREREGAETERLRQLFSQSLSFMVVLRGAEHRFELINPAYSQLVSHRDVVGKTVREALPEVESQGFFELLDRVYSTGEAFVGRSAPFSIQPTPGAPLEERFLDFVYQPIRNADGAVNGIFVEGIDVTQTHDLVTALRDSEAQFRTFAQAMPNQVWTSPPTGALDWFNEQTFIFSGLDHDALTGNGWVQIVHPDDIDGAAAAWAKSLTTGERYEVEFRLRRADGIYRWHLARALPIRDDAGELVRWIGTNTDIHDRKLAEVESTAERDRIWTTTNDLMGTIGLDGFPKAVNPAWSRLLGYDDQELLSRPFLDIVDPADHAKLAEVGTRLTVARTVGDFENSLIHKDNSRSLIGWTAERFEDVFYVVGRDITAQRHAEDALRQSQKMEAVGQLTGGIAHDFNNLLQGITGSLDLVQKRIAQGRLGEVERFVTGAMTSANRAAALTHRLLAFSRRQPLDPRPVRTNPLLASMEDLLRRTLGERIELELVLAGGLWLTHCDPNQLENAVLNLAINARDAMPDGGSLTIETGNAHLDSAYTAKQRDVRPGQYVCISVTDTGTGMSADTIAKAFEPFFTTKPIGQGTGLGLSMIYGFARQSEGYAKIYSEIGKGTTVKLYLPRHRGTAEDDEAASALAPHHAANPGETVLVVEDESVVRGLIVEVLSDLGYNALESADGPSGLEILRSRRRVDLLVTDIGLPGLNGRQLAEAGRALRPDLKVLFMTGYAENAALASGFLEPGMSMITKPFAMEILATKIRDIIENS
jgi:PAS domain S-box-containing protein